MGLVLRPEGSTENPTLPRPYGRQATAGRLAYFVKIGGQYYGILFLGCGVMDGIDGARFKGRLLTPYNAATGVGHYVFHPGTYPDPALGYADPVQGRPVFFPAWEDTYPGIAYIEFRLDAEMTEAAGDSPTDFEIFVRGLRVPDWNADGTQMAGPGNDSEGRPLVLCNTATGPRWLSYSANNARVWADLAEQCGQIDVAARIDWPSWVAFRTRCNQLIAWLDASVGMTGAYYSGANFDALLFTKQETLIDFVWDDPAYLPPGVPSTPFTVRFTGTFVAPGSGLFTFDASVDDGARLFIDGNPVFSRWPGGSEQVVSGTYNLVAGQSYAMVLEYYQAGVAPPNPGALHFHYAGPGVPYQLVPPTDFRQDTPRQIPRFDCHVVFPTSTELNVALNAVMTRAPGCTWQYVGVNGEGKYRFIETPVREPVYTFVYDPTQTVVRSNVVQKSFSSDRKSIEDKFDYLRAEFRDIDDTFFKKSYAFADRPLVRYYRSAGVGSGEAVPNDPGVITMGVMNQSLAERIVEYSMRWGTDLDKIVRVKGQRGSHGVAVGDAVWVAHKTEGGTLLEPVKYIVVKEAFLPGTETAEEKDYTLQLYDDSVYSDTDHGPLVRRRRGGGPMELDAPPVIDDVSLGVVTTRGGDNTVNSIIRGTAVFPDHPHPMAARVWVKRPSDPGYVIFGRLLRPNADTGTDVFEIPAPEVGLYDVVVRTQTPGGYSRPFVEHPVFSQNVTGWVTAPTDPTGLVHRIGENGQVVWDWDDAPPADAVLFWRIYDADGNLVKDRVGSSTWSEPPSADVLSRKITAVNTSFVESGFSATVNAVLRMPTPTDGVGRRDGHSTWRFSWKRGPRVPDIKLPGEEFPRYTFRIYADATYTGVPKREVPISRPSNVPMEWEAVNLPGFPCGAPATTNMEGGISHPGDPANFGCIWRSQVIENDARIKFVVGAKLTPRVIQLADEDGTATEVLWDTTYFGQQPRLIPAFKNDRARRPMPGESYAVEIRQRQAYYLGPRDEILYVSDEIPITTHYRLYLSFGQLDGTAQELRSCQIEPTQIELYFYTAEMQVRDFGAVQNTLHVEIVQVSESPSVSQSQPLRFTVNA